MEEFLLRLSPDGINKKSLPQEQAGFSNNRSNMPD